MSRATLIQKLKSARKLIDDVVRDLEAADARDPSGAGPIVPAESPITEADRERVRKMLRARGFGI